MNAQAWSAPSKADIDAWAKFGNSSWDWAVLAPYYKRAHTLHPRPIKQLSTTLVSIGSTTNIVALQDPPKCASLELFRTRSVRLGLRLFEE